MVVVIQCNSIKFVGPGTHRELVCPKPHVARTKAYKYVIMKTCIETITSLHGDYMISLLRYSESKYFWVSQRRSEWADVVDVYKADADS